MNILLISASGFLGQELFSGLQKQGFNVKSAGRNGQDIFLDLQQGPDEAFVRALQEGNFNCGIICAAVSDIEEAYRFPERSQQINVVNTLRTLQLFKCHQIKPIFFSSDLVFGNSRDWYLESDPLQPTTLYGHQKAAVEEFMREEMSEFLVFRTSKLMSMNLHPRNILTPIILALQNSREIKLFRNQFISPIFIEDIALAVGLAIAKKLSGIYHLSNNERYSRIDLAHNVAKYLGTKGHFFQEVDVEDFPFSEKRGHFFTIKSDAFQRATGFTFTPLSLNGFWARAQK